VACQAFLYRKSWFLFTLLVFIAGQSILKHLNEGENGPLERNLIFGFRSFIYLFSMTQLLYTHIGKWFKSYRSGDTMVLFNCVKIPTYLQNWQDAAGFSLMVSLITMLALEPILHCLSDDHGKLFYEGCDQAKETVFAYSVFSMFAMFLYYSLLLDLAVLSTKVSAYVLVCTRMLSEVGLFLLALAGIMLMFSSAISVLKHDQESFSGIHKGLLALLQITMKMYTGAQYEEYESDPMVLVCVFFFMVVVSIFFLNMLIAQLTCAYEAVYVDMVGYARLERIQIINSTMPVVSESRWKRFIIGLKLEEKTEFLAGDVGVTGGIATTEPANANPTTFDMIRRFGGSTSPDMQWPVDDLDENDENDRFEKMEKTIGKILKRFSKGAGGGGKGGKGSGTGNSGSGSGDQGSGHDDDSEGSAGEEA